ncbi:ctd nuclear envelope phosphatase [Anaeramoeba flamelloides]|uniref:Ctd nuclear envelope phosphatase n=1 Tax=Anaeramoeba flamelloides TaxID=1746091 RepID=A0AAV7Z755_9EUKA|nr:ctd nuclear envelope phosphatase [Anaeramoeba flamelloides]|eukprot:Anaeramoba_flamelloidesa94084_24.p1 GENE.a94084_24~~a94084_24.p1  ORF type:complete len:231 (+),score=29.35 a94084_24:86-694(+)
MMMNKLQPYFDLFYDPPRRQEKLKNRRKLTLVLDLDETLVHSCQIPKPNLKYDMTVKCTIQKIETLFYVYKRPYVDQFLKQASKWFNIVIFTSSLQVYADPIIDFLDPNQQVKERLFRESCEQLAGNWIKDLSVLFTRFDRCVIVDNSPVAFTRNWENGIPIRTWDGDPLDKELKKLLTFLDGLRSLRDVRHILKFRSLSYN